MKNSLLFPLSLVVTIIGCATAENACEDITLASEQIHECQSLQTQITNAKGKPILRTELERRFQQDCIDIRYYRDDHQVGICGNKEEIEKVRQNAIEKSN